MDMDREKLKKLLKNIERATAKRLRGLNYNGIDFEFYAMMAIENLNLDNVDGKTKHFLREEFAKRAKNNFFNNGENIYEITAEILESLEKVGEDEFVVSEELKELGLEMLEEKKERESMYEEFEEFMRTEGFPGDDLDRHDLDEDSDAEVPDTETVDINIDAELPPDLPF